jgi:S-DNA-T family DNA segregation ATPase FtsK/SpoIIIE
MAVKKEFTRSGGQEILGIALLAVCVLSILSLFSHDSGDVGMVSNPPHDPPRNFIGPVGAWFAYLSFMGWGVGGYILPALFSFLGLSCLFKREGRIWPKFVWAVVLLLASSSLLELNGSVWEGVRDRLNIGSSGGLMGDLLAARFLVPLLGVVGAGILATAILIMGLIMLIDLHPGTLVRHCWDLLLAGSARWQEMRRARMDRLQQMEAEQEQLAKRRRRLEDAMKEAEPAAPRVRTRKANEDGREEALAVRARTRLPDQEAVAATSPARARARMPDPEPVAVTPVPELVAEETEPDEREKESGGLARLFGRKSREQEAEEIAETPEVAPPPSAPEGAEEKAVPAPVPAPGPRARARVPDLEKVAESLAVLPAGGTNWVLPDISLLEPVPTQREVTSVTEFAIGAQVLKETLAEFGVDVEVTNVERGPAITRYELLPAPGVRVETIAKLNNNIALAMKAETVRVQAPIPGKGVVGIEVPNPKTTIVFFREVIESDDWRKGKAALPLCLGQDVGGRVQIADLADMPHLLVAGATGSGKTVCMNSMLAGLLLSRTPDQLRLMLIDPKIVEFSGFNGLPHLVVPVITDPKKVSLGLRWAINEMEKRYKLFAKVGVRNIKGFNSRPIIKQEELFPESEGLTGPTETEEKIPERVPYIVIVVDELADLMLVAQADIENQIARLAQLSRAVGIHMILATQRPSVNVITGTIKANFPARISFQVAQKVDSRTILDAAGADKLLGKGDMLFLPPGSPKLIRAQGTLTTDAEMLRVVDHWKRQGVPQYENSIKDKIEGKQVDLPDMEEDDELINQSIEIIRQTRRASTSSLQRRLRIGYTRAARIMDLLEQRGMVGPAEGSDPREILIDLDGEVPSNNQQAPE